MQTLVSGAAPAAITEEGVQALLNPAKTMLFGAAISGNIRTLTWAQASIKTLNALLDGTAQRYAEFARSKGGYKVAAIFESAWPVLPVGVENFTLVEVQEFLRAHGVEVAADALANGEFDGVVQFKDAALPVVNLNHEHGAARADVGDGASEHDAAFVVETATVAQGGAA